MPAVFGGTSILSACSPASDPQGYEAVAASTWRASPLAGVEGAALTRELVHCATLAPSSHNTQPTQADSAASMPGWVKNTMMRLLGSDFLFWAAIHVAHNQVLKVVLATPPELLPGASP